MMDLRRGTLESFNFKSDVVKYELVEKAPSQEEVVLATDIKLPDESPAKMKILRTEGKKWYLSVVYHEATEQPFALFCHTNNREKGAQTSDAVQRLIGLARRKGILDQHIESTMIKAEHDGNVSKLTRVISLNLRHGVLPFSIVNELDKMEDIFVGSFLFQIKKFLSNYIKEGQKAEGETCAGCQSTRLVYSEGCLSCLDCGGSKCS
jgi:hypothetical protein